MPSKEQMKSNDQIRAKHRATRPAAQNAEAQEQEMIPAGAAQKAGLAPDLLTSRDMLQLQRTIGNQALQRQLTGPVIQRRGTYAPINIMQANNVNAIEEQEYGSGAAVALTAITSCVGFLARAGNQVFGLHLGVLDANSVDVSTVNLPALVNAIGAIWPANPDAVFQVGMINNWQGGVLSAIYPTVFGAADLGSEVNQSGNIYSATIVNNKLQVSRGAQIIWTES